MNEKHTVGQQNFQKLVDQVPTGIGIYEAYDGKVSQVYMNDAFYAMLGTTREEREQYGGENAITAAHPEDIEVINAALHKLLSGADYEEVTYRVKIGKEQWMWMHLNVSVSERRENFIRVYAAFTNYDRVMLQKKELEKNQSTLETALKSVGVLTWRYDYRRRRITDSMTLGEKYGLPKIVDDVPETIIRMGFIAEESQEEYRGFFRDEMMRRTISTDTKATAKVNGEEMWFRQIYTPTLDEEGNYLDSIAVAIDITEQKQKEHHYEEMLQLNRAASKDALSTVSMNLSRNQINDFCSNSEEFDMHAKYCAADELLATTMSNITDEEERKKFAPVADCSTMIQQFKAGCSHIEIFCHFGDNTRWLQVDYDMLENPYNGDIEAISSIYDVTDSVRAQMVVNRLIDVDYQALILIDPGTGRAIPYQMEKDDFNLEEIARHQENMGDEVQGFEQFLRTYVPRDTVEQVVLENSPGYIEEQLKQHAYYECMYSLNIQQKLSHYRILYCYLQGDSGVILCAVQNVTEIYEKEVTQKNKLASALLDAQASNRAKTAFLSRVSHDMRTPLNGILGLTALLKNKTTDEAILRDLADLELSGNYLLNLINDTLDVNRIESGRLELHPTVCEGEALFHNAVRLAKANIDAKHIDFQLHADKLPFSLLYVDTGRIEQVVMNVLGNAIKFTPEGGTIEVGIRNLAVSNGFVTDQLTIRDNGIGISPEFLPHVFEAFSQEDASTTNSRQGTGLGMSITKRIVELMGGEISVTSEKGKGTCFTIILNLQIAAEEQIEEWKKKQRVETEKIDLSGRRVLLCEDHPLNASIATKLLASKGMLVEHAENGQIGVSMFEHSEPEYYDAILMDIRMPVMDGLDAARAIRNLLHPYAGKIPIIAMTANALKNDIEQTKKAGMNAHLSKPIQTETLFATLGELLKCRESDGNVSLREGGFWDDGTDK